MPNTTIVNYRVAGNLPTNQTLRGSWEREILFCANHYQPLALPMSGTRVSSPIWFDYKMVSLSSGFLLFS